MTLVDTHGSPRWMRALLQKIDQSIYHVAEASRHAVPRIPIKACGIRRRGRLGPIPWKIVKPRNKRATREPDGSYKADRRRLECLLRVDLVYSLNKNESSSIFRSMAV